MRDFHSPRVHPLVVVFRYLALFTLLGMTFTAGILVERSGVLSGFYSQQPPGLSPTFAPFWQTWHLVHEYYVDRSAINDERLAQGATSGMLAALGDVGHTTYLTREELHRLEQGLKGEFQGIGAVISMDKRRPTIRQTMPGSPARTAGLKPGDILIEVDGKDVSHLSLEQLVQDVRGPAGTVVRLKVQRDGASKPLDFTITRGKVDVPDVTWQMLPDAPIAQVAIRNFGENTDEQLRVALEEAHKHKVRGLLLDVRGNPGGLKEQAVAVTSEFLHAGQTVFIEQDARGHEKKIAVKPDGLAPQISLVVLIDEGTASSAEIFAGALQDYRRGQLVGTRTFGTGTVLKPFELSDGSAVLLAVDQWLTPKGRKIWHEGIAPDVEVELPAGVSILSPNDETKLTTATFTESKDTQIHKAFALLRKELDR
jgi:carboxyl-terminal processing protease